MHVDSHLSCPAVMEPRLRASLRRIHAPKSIKLCVSKGGDSIFPAQLNGTVRLRFCLRGVGRGELWSQGYAHFGAVQVWLMNHKPKPGSSLLSSLRCRREIRQHQTKAMLHKVRQGTGSSLTASLYSSLPTEAVPLCEHRKGSTRPPWKLSEVQVCLIEHSSPHVEQPAPGSILQDVAA